MKRSILLALATLLSFASPARAQQGFDSETRVFPLATGELVVVENDYGKVSIRSGDVTQAEVKIRRVASDNRRLREIDIITQKVADRLFLEAFFFDYQGESVEFDLIVPRGVRVVVSGANAQVDLQDLEEYVRVHTMTGNIIARNLTGSTSLLSEFGDIDLRLPVQPRRDIRAESVRGRVLVQAAEGINMFAYARAGGTLQWEGGIELSPGKLSRDIGDGAGPLLYASSLEGNVSVRISGALQSGPAPVVISNRDPLPDPRSDPVDTGSGRGRDPRRDPIGTRDERGRDGPPTLGSDSDDDQHARRDEPQNTSGGDETPAYTVESSGGAETAADGTPLFRADVNLIHLNVAVHDRRNNRAVANLRRGDFRVYEDGVEQRIERFSSTEAPFNLLLLLDVSGSTRNEMDLIQDASVDFTREIKRNDRIAIAAFNERPKLIQDFTNDRREVANAIHSLRSGGGTAFYDALFVSVQEYMRGVEGRKAIVVFTDGVDGRLQGDPRSGSRVSFRQLFRSVQEVDTTIYTIFLDTRATVGGRRGGSGGGSVVDILEDILRGGGSRRTGGGAVDRQYREAEEQLRMIADQTGGRTYTPRSIRDLNHVYSEIADDLRVQYTLAYSSTNPAQDGSWREIEVDIRNRRDLTARTRKGYYATPNNQSSRSNRVVP